MSTPLLHADSAPNPVHPGTILRQARQHRGLSQSALARASGITQCTISRLELGQSQASVGTFLQLLRTVLHTEPPVTREYLRDRVPFDGDPVARYVVAMHPDGLTGDQVAKVLGLHPRVVDSEIARALAKLRHAAEADPTLRAVVADVLGRVHSSEDDTDDARAA